MSDLVNISFGTAGVIAILGYAVVFSGLVLLMLVIRAMGALMAGSLARERKEAAAANAESSAPLKSADSAASSGEDGSEAVLVSAAEAPGTAGEFKLHGVDPRDAAMAMAIVADTIGKPLNELRFISIKEIKE